MKRLNDEDSVVIPTLDEQPALIQFTRVETINPVQCGFIEVLVQVGALAIFAFFFSLIGFGFYRLQSRNGTIVYEKPFDYAGRSEGALIGVPFNLTFVRIGSFVTVCFSPLHGIVGSDGIGLAINMPVPSLPANLIPTFMNMVWTTVGINGGSSQLIYLGWDRTLKQFFTRPGPTYRTFVDGTLMKVLTGLGPGYVGGLGGTIDVTCGSYIRTSLSED